MKSTETLKTSRFRPALTIAFILLGLLNPCIVAPAEVKLTAGKPLVLRYRVATFDGALPTQQLNALAAGYSGK